MFQPDNSFGKDDTKVNIIYVGKQIFISICLYWKTLTLEINNRMQKSFLIDTLWWMCNSTFLPTNLPSVAKSILKSADNILTQLPPT